MLERGSPNSIPIMECGKVSGVWGVMGSGGGVLGVVESVVCDVVWSGVCGVEWGVWCDGEWGAVWSGVWGVMGSGVQCGEVICSI